MRLAKISDITIPPRQRAHKPPKHIQDLKQSILGKGLLHPPVLSQKDGKLSLVVGECRLTAISELITDGHPFTCDNQPVPLGMVPYNLIGDLSLADLAEAELEENLLRASLTWQEESDARVLIYNLRSATNPNIPQLTVAKEIAEKSGKSTNAENIALHKALVVSKNKSNPVVASSKSLNEAFTKLMDIEAAHFQATLVKSGVIKTDHQVILGDCLSELKNLEGGSFDIICSDPPYGIKADKMKRTEEHFYDDSPETALTINKAIIREGFRLLKPRGIIFLFCDIRHFNTLVEYAAQQAYTPWETPVIWRKGEEGFAPWGRLGFTRTYEIFAFFSKGERGLKGGGPDVKDFKRPARTERVHAAEKPVPLLSYLLSIAGDPGDRVLDPCCGSGPIFEAATANKMTAVGIEKSPDYHALALARLAKSSEEPTDVPLPSASAELRA